MKILLTLICVALSVGGGIIGFIAAVIAIGAGIDEDKRD